jgi:hypothetical protein
MAREGRFALARSHDERIGEALSRHQPDSELLFAPGGKVNPTSFGGQRDPGPLGDDLAEFGCELVAVTSQLLIERPLRPLGRFLRCFPVLSRFALVLLEFSLKIAQHRTTPRHTTWSEWSSELRPKR